MEIREELLRKKAAVSANKRRERDRFRNLGGGFKIAIALFVIVSVPTFVAAVLAMHTNEFGDDAVRNDFPFWAAVPASFLGSFWLGDWLAIRIGRRRAVSLLSNLGYLPFPVHGLEPILGELRDEWLCEIEFGKTLPDLATLEAALCSVSPLVRASATLVGQTAKIELTGAIDVVIDEGRRELTNKDFDCGKWLDKASFECLPALHGAHPIIELRLC